MEALVNAAYDRISEDVILLYDAIQAYEEVSPRPAPSAVLQAIRQVLKEEDRGLGNWGKSTDNLRRIAGLSRQNSSNDEQDADAWATKASLLADEVEAEYVEESGAREFFRALITSVLSDLAVLPFWTVKISAVAHRGRLPELWPFQGYRIALWAIYQAEGPRGVFKGALPVCVGGLLRYFRRNKRLYSDYYWKTTHRLTARLVMKGNFHAHVNDPEVMAQSYEGVLARVFWATLLHPFDLVATRMITEPRPQYQTLKSSFRYIRDTKGWAGFFLGFRASIFNTVLPFGNWYLFGVPFLIKTRRMLDGQDSVFRAGMGGSLDLVRAIINSEGFSGLFAGFRATCWGMIPAFGALCVARLLVHLIMGSSARTASQRKRRKALLRRLLSSWGQGKGHMSPSSSSNSLISRRPSASRSRDALGASVL